MDHQRARELVDLKPDGSFRMAMEYFDYCHGLTMTSAKFDGLFGGPPRAPEASITQREMDIAASIQKVTEDIMLRCARHVREIKGMKKLCLTGGVALNCVGNGNLLREGPFDEIWIQPAAGDVGGALGVAQLIWFQLLDNPRAVDPRDGQRGSFLGPSFSASEAKAYLDLGHACCPSSQTWSTASSAPPWSTPKWAITLSPPTSTGRHSTS